MGAVTEYKIDQFLTLEKRRRDLVTFAANDLDRNRAAEGFVALLEQSTIFIQRHQDIRVAMDYKHRDVTGGEAREIIHRIIII